MNLKKFISEYYWIAGIPLIVWSLISGLIENQDINQHKTKVYGMVYGSSPIYKKNSKRSYRYKFFYKGKNYTGESSAYESENVKYGNFYKVEFSQKNPKYSRMIFDTLFVQKIKTNENGKTDTTYMPFKHKVQDSIRNLIKKYSLEE